MKIQTFLKIFVLLIVAVSAPAATPDYKAFLGTNGVNVTSNPPSGKIIIGGTFNYLPQAGTNYLLPQDRRMEWGAYRPYGATAPNGQGDFTVASVLGTIQANKDATSTNSHYGVIRATGAPIGSSISAIVPNGMFSPTNKVFMYTVSGGFSNAPGTNVMKMDLANMLLFSTGDPYARCGWFAQTAGSSGTNWTATFLSNATDVITVHTSTARTDQWHTLAIGNLTGNNLVWFMDGVPVFTNTTPGNVGVGGIGASPYWGQRVTLSPNGTNFMFWKTMELIHELTDSVGTGPL